MKQISSILLLLITTAFALPVKKKIKIFMAGDSTMAIKQPRAFPETGWGMPCLITGSKNNSKHKK